MKIVLNKAAAPFTLSGPAEELYYAISGRNFNDLAFERHDEALVEVLKTMGTTASGLGCTLQLAEVPNTDYEIVTVDGMEEAQTTAPKETKNAQAAKPNQEPV